MQFEEIKFNNKKYKIKLRDLVDKSVLAEIFTEREYRVAEQIIKVAKDPILDVGAHVGFFILYCRAINESVRIYGLEPEPENFQMLAQNLKTNKIKEVKIFQQALALSSGYREFYLAEDNHNHSLLALSLKKIKQVISAQTVNFSEFCQNNKIERLSLVKMDIEGGEYEILEKLPESDWQKIEAIILEYHDFKNDFNDLNHKQLEQILRQNSFSVEIFPSHFQNNLGFILARNKKIK